MSSSAAVPASFAADCQKLLAGEPEPGSALLPMLQLAQSRWGHVSEVVAGHIASLLSIPPARVLALVSFLPALRSSPAGEHVLALCSGLPCCLCGARQVQEHICQRLGIDMGQTTADGRITLEWAPCLGACATGPALLADGQLQDSLTLEQVDLILERLC